MLKRIRRNGLVKIEQRYESSRLEAVFLAGAYDLVVPTVRRRIVPGEKERAGSLPAGSVVPEALAGVER